jgi:hypothetical protein
MTKVRYLKVQFDKNLMAYEIPYFRAAVIEASERKSSLFHNHDGKDKVIYRYPLIQYKILQKRPAIICLESATDDIHHLLQNQKFEFRIKSKKVNFSIEDIHMTFVNMQTWDKAFRYNLLHYIPFNQEFYERYKKMDGVVEEMRFLQEKLYSHIVGIMKQLNINEPIPLNVVINKILSTKYIEYKGQFHLTFNLEFTSNILMADNMGIGKGVSVGFGILKNQGNK